MAKPASSKTKQPATKAKTTAAVKARPAPKAARAKPAVKAKPPTKAKPAKAKSPPKATPAAKATSAVKVKPPTKAKPAGAEPAAASKRPVIETLGSITCPSGKLAILDIGLVGYLPRPALEPMIVKADVPRDRPLSVTGTRVGRGRFADCWDHVSINLADGDVHQARKLGEAGVDFARLAFIDHAALAHWRHEDSLDGLADVVFWGRDEAALAKALRAPKTKEGHGWCDLDLMDAESKVMEAEILKADNNWMINVDFRPHSHHFHALAAARSNPAGAGVLDVGGSRMLLFFTSWGDGVFPIYLDLDAEDRPVRVRIQLATAESTAAMQTVNS